MRYTVTTGSPLRRKSASQALFAAIAAFLTLVFSACADGAKPPRRTTVTTITGAADTALPKRIVFSVGETAPDYMLTSVEAFCRRANSISNGDLTVSFIKSGDPLADFNGGRADIILLDGKGAEKLHRFFAIANEPFRYQSYENFSITCNYARMLRRLSEASGTRVFAAYYTGSSVFAGYDSLDGALNTKRGAEPEPGTEPRETKLIANPGSDEWLRTHFPGVAAAELSDPFGRIRAISGDTLAELPVETGIAAALAALVPEYGQGDEPKLTVTRSFHDTIPTWLILSPALYEGLTVLGRAAIDEAAAFMTEDIDGVCLERERKFINILEDADITISSEFTASRARIFRTRAARFPELPLDEREFRELLDGFR